MAELDDLDTSSIGFLAFWNIEDDGGIGSSDWTVDEVTTDGNIVSTTTYDNGIEGEYNFPNGTHYFRVKSDGWFIAWTDDSGSLIDTDHQGSPPNGEFDALNNWAEQNSVSNQGDQNSCAWAINNLWREIGNSGLVSWAYADVGFYNYNYGPDGATTTTILSQGGSSGGSGNISSSFLYTSGTNVHKAYACHAVEGDDSETYIEGEEMATDGDGYAVVDMIETNRWPSSSGTDLTQSVDFNDPYNSSYNGWNISVVMCWE